jgi:hypothetical protein
MKRNPRIARYEIFRIAIKIVLGLFSRPCSGILQQANLKCIKLYSESNCVDFKDVLCEIYTQRRPACATNNVARTRTSPPLSGIPIH